MTSSTCSVKILVLLLVFTVPFFVFAEDHTNYIAGPFDNPQQVTENCLMCHQEEAESFMHTVHWTWSSKPMKVPGHSEKVNLGKRNVLNNFCIGLRTNFPRCTSCHAGYGWKDTSFDFSDPKNIDCLVCHDNTGTYEKTPTGAGLPSPEVDLVRVAQSVGPTTRESCGSCHFYGGGGNNVKHGDLENALVNPSRELDVHMGGQDFTCTECHMTEGHKIEGNALSVSTNSKQTVACEHCHTEAPHTKKYAAFLNKHTERIACQTCHIPEFARANPTKMYWDWSTAGEDRPDSLDEYGKPTYAKKKGSFIWGKNVIPTYAWYSGESTHMLVGDEVQLNVMNDITKPIGSKDEPDSKIYPFKVHRGKQIADAQYNYLLPTHLFGGFWNDFDWNKSVSEGAAAYNLRYSGEFTFVKTEMYWKINHMVTPKEEALECTDCHSKVKETRLDWKTLGYDGDPINKK